MRRLFILSLFFPFCLFLSQNLSAQKFPNHLYLPIHGPIAKTVERMDVLHPDSFSHFTVNRPWRVDKVKRIIEQAHVSKADDANRMLFRNLYSTAMLSKKPIAHYFYRQPAHLFSINNKEFTLFVDPLFHLEYGREANIDENKYINTRGVLVQGELGNKLGFYTEIDENQGNFMSYVMDRKDAMFQVLPGNGRVKPFKINSIDFMNARGYLSFNLLPQISLQFGQDNLFLGNGIRSFMLSDFTNNYSFLRLDTRFWRIEYQNIFAQLVDFRKENVADGPIARKWIAIHHLGIQLFPKFNLGLFEGVAFAPDSSRNGFEWYYLNPVIFYRSVEYQLGSADNVLMGLDWKYNFLRHFSFYGQVVIDDLRYWDLLKSTGWWGNKYALQGGLKYFDAFGIANLDLQTEFNTARPYTFSHDNPAISWSHYGQALAHPLGANFREWLFSADYQAGARFFLHATAFHSLYGADSGSSNFGSNILLDNSLHGPDYGHITGEGIPTRLNYLKMSFSWMWRPNIFFGLQWTMRKQNSDWAALKQKTNYIGISFRMNFANRDFMF